MKNLILLVLLPFVLDSCQSGPKFLLSPIVISPLFTFNSGIAAMAGPAKVDGKIYYKIYRLRKQAKAHQRMGRCVVQHGYGVQQQLLKFHKYTFDVFVKTYFGMDLIQGLLDRPCQEVIVSMQESSQTTILEMTERTEKFLYSIAYMNRGMHQDNQKKSEFAYIGHSKGGAVAFNIARRCMQMNSLLGKEGCFSLKEIYSAAGVIQGAMASFVAYGAMLLKKKKEANLFTRAVGFQLNLVWEIYTEYIPGKTNPTWADLNPGAPMEEGRPLFVINDIDLAKKGWLKADFAASATTYRFSGSGQDKLHGCGSRIMGMSLNWFACQEFGNEAGALHNRYLKSAFIAGIKKIREHKGFGKSNQKERDFYKEVTWERFQQSDGLADYYLAISSCKRGLRVKEGRAVQSCFDLPEVNHMGAAGGSPLARAHIISELSR